MFLIIGKTTFSIDSLIINRLAHAPMNPLGSNWSIRILGKTGSVVKNWQNRVGGEKQEKHGLLKTAKQQKVFINIYCLLKIIEVSMLIEIVMLPWEGQSMNTHSWQCSFVFAA